MLLQAYFPNTHSLRKETDHQTVRNSKRCTQDRRWLTPIHIRAFRSETRMIQIAGSLQLLSVQNLASPLNPSPRSHTEFWTTISKKIKHFHKISRRYSTSTPVTTIQGTRPVSTVDMQVIPLNHHVLRVAVGAPHQLSAFQLSSPSF